MKRIFAFVLVGISSLIGSPYLFAQQSEHDSLNSTAVERQALAPENAVYLELLGTVLTYSVNYERRFDAISIRVGIEPFEGPAIPILINYHFGKSGFEVGAGAILLPTQNFPYTRLNDPKKSFLLTADFGFRNEVEGRGLLYRVTFVVIFAEKHLGGQGFLPGGGSLGNTPIIPWLGVSIGYAF